MPTPRWPVALFDLDGTLVDTIGLIVASYEHALESVLGRKEPETRIRSWIGTPLETVFRGVAPEHVRPLVDAYVAWNHAHSERLIRRFEGVDGLLAELRRAGARVAVVTSKRRVAAELALDLVGLRAAVDGLFTLEDSSAHKPDPEPLRVALRRLGSSARDACYVGDAVVDLLAAERAGIAGVGVTWGAAPRHELGAAPHTQLCDSVAQLASLLLP